MRFKAYLMGTALSAAAFAGASSSFAQEAPGADATQVDEIVVTAQRREERLQKVPVAVTVLTSESREELGLISAQAIANVTPGVSLSPISLSVRGVGRYTTTLGADAGVTVYNDGFYSDEATTIGRSTLFVDRVEILRGPQGTLFGRNSIGGSANVVGRRPSYEPEGEVRFSLGNYREGSAGFTVSGPINDRLRYRLGAEALNREDGYIDNIAPGQRDLLDAENLYVEAQISWDITPNIDAWVKYSHYEYDQSPALLTSAIETSPYFSRVFFPAASLVPAAGYDIDRPNPSVNDMRKVDYDNPGYSKLVGNHEVVAHLNWDTGPVTLGYIGGFWTGRTEAQGDYDGTSRSSYVISATGPDPLQPPAGSPVSSNYIYSTGTDSQYFSHEITARNSTAGRLTWIVGANFLRQHQVQPYDLRAPDVAALEAPIYAVPPYPAAPVNPNRNFYSQLGTLTTRSIGAFGQASYELTPTVKLTAGVRYTEDRKIGTETFRFVYWNPADGGLIGPACCAFESTPAVNSRRLEQSWDGVTGRLSLDWSFSENALAYASYSRGYKSGGFSLGQVAEVATVRPEFLNAFEVGLKQRVGQNIQVNGAVFYYDYSDFQVPVTVLRGSGPAGNITQTQFVNAEAARTYGVELETIWNPTPALSLFANYSYLDAKAEDFCCVLDIADPALGNQDLSGRPLPQSPENKVTIGGSYTFATARGDVVLSAINAFVDKQFYSPFGSSRYEGDAYNITNFNVTWTDPSDAYRVSAYVRNAFDEDFIYGLTLGPASVDSPRTVAPGDPRTFGLQVTRTF